LRRFNGREQPIIDFLQAQSDVQDMGNDIRDFVSRWLPMFESENRAYLTVSIGCTAFLLNSREVTSIWLRRSRYAFQSSIDIEKDGQRVNSKSIMGVMMLAASCGSTVSITAEGDDQQAAIDAITDLIDRRFDEEE